MGAGPKLRPSDELVAEFTTAIQEICGGLSRRRVMQDPPAGHQDPPAHVMTPRMMRDRFVRVLEGYEREGALPEFRSEWIKTELDLDTRLMITTPTREAPEWFVEFWQRAAWRSE